MAVGDEHVFLAFSHNFSSQSHRLLFSHASAAVRGENTPERKFTTTGDRTHNHKVMSPTRSPLSHLGGVEQIEKGTYMLGDDRCDNNDFISLGSPIFMSMSAAKGNQSIVGAKNILKTVTYR